MLVSYNLLTKYVDLPKDVAEVAQKLTMATVEVEQVIEKGKTLDKVVVGKVVKLLAHPNADKLKLADVEIGEVEPVRVVCGGTNLEEGMLVVFAKVGASVRWHGEGDLVKLEKAEIRGEKSQGMVCASNELGLDEILPCGEMEIVDISHLKLKVGDKLVDALGLDDILFDIDNKSLTNRPDLWSHYGIARELAAIYELELKPLELNEDIKIKEGKYEDLEVDIKDKDLCPRYLGCVVENIKVAESPEWLKKKLLATGHSVINNVVDITNYVMEEVGQPMHAFDKKLIGTEIITHLAKKGEELVTLDDEKRELSAEMLVIADKDKPIAVAGVMGGKSTAVTEQTTAIVLEAANFEAMSIRKTSQALDLRSDASTRFEKALDANLAETGMRRAVQLIKELIPQAKVSEYIVEDGEWQKDAIEINLSLEFIEKRIGKKIAKKDILGSLERLGFELTVKGNELNIKVPSWRATGDVDIKEDIVEEVARIYGYDNLEERQEMVELTTVKYQKEFDLENKVKNYLAVVCGMNEVFNYAWPEEKLIKSLGIKDKMIEMANPPTQETRFLQTTLIPNLVKNVEDNLRFFDEFRIFELARVYINKKAKWGEKAEDKLPEQPKYLAGAVVVDKKDDAFKEIKGILEGLFELFGLNLMDYLVKHEFQTTGKFSYLEIENGQQGRLIELKGNYRNKKVVLFEVNFDKLVEAVSDEKKYQPLPQYPSVERDIAIELNWQVKWAEIKAEVEKIDELIDRVEFLSEYPLEDKKSLAFRVIYQADRTLKDEEVEKVEKKILAQLKKKFEAELRK